MNKLKAIWWGFIYFVVFIFMGAIHVLTSTILDVFPNFSPSFIKECGSKYWKEVKDDGEPFRIYIKSLWNSKGVSK